MLQTINLFGSTNKGLSAAINDQVNENCYLVSNYNGRGTVALVGAMGSEEFSSTSIGIARGAYLEQIGDYAYFVAGPSLWRVDESGTAFFLGSIPGADLVSIVYDGTSLVVFNSTNIGYYFNTITSAFSATTLPAVAYTGAILDTFVVFSSDNSRWYVSNVGDSDSWDVLDFATENKSPDELVAIWEDHSELILFGARTIIPWFNSGGTDFTFSQNTAGAIERGVYARYSIAKEDNTLFFLGDDLIVYRMQGYQAVRVSTDGIDTILSNIQNTSGNLSSAYAFIYVEHGHKFYQLTIPNQITLVLDISSGEWHTRKHWDIKTHHAKAYCRAFNKHLIGTTLGHVYDMSRDYFEDGSQPLRRLRRTQIVSNNDQILHWKKLKFVMEFGTTEILSGQGSDPLMVLRWSDNFGKTYGNEKHLPLGENGKYVNKAIKRNCGSSRARVFEFYVTDPVPFIMIGALASIT